MPSRSTSKWNTNAAMSNTISIKSFTGESVKRFIPEVARLRIEVFRDFPYLYDGTAEYEAKYLRTYTESPDSVLVIAFDGDKVIGASTALPLKHEMQEIKRPFLERNINVEDVFYLGESVLNRRYRGQGIGVRFFEEREAHAQRIGRFKWAAFCAVERPDNHPLRPAGYVPLNKFWNNRGYYRKDDFRTSLSWQEINELSETAKPMVFWLKDF